MRTILQLLRSQGILGTASLALNRGFGRPARAFAACRPLVDNRAGLEIGGPSPPFRRRGLLPLYPLARRIDNCSFACATVWEGALREGDPFHFHPPKPPGIQCIREATDLHGLGDGSYDFVCCSHVIEHLANPIGGLLEWRRVLRPGGALILIAPHRDGTFDRRRPITTLDHLRQDQANRTPEDDRTHLEESVRLTDLSLVPPAPVRDGAPLLQLFDLAQRTVHHHVFDTALVVQLLDAAGFALLAVQAVRPFNILAVALKRDDPDNTRWLSPVAKYRQPSPFQSDRPKR